MIIRFLFKRITLCILFISIGFSTLSANECYWLGQVALKSLEFLKLESETYQIVYGEQPQQIMERAVKIDSLLHKKARFKKLKDNIRSLDFKDLEDLSITAMDELIANSRNLVEWGSKNQPVSSRELSDYVRYIEINGKKYVYRVIDPDFVTDTLSITDGRAIWMASKVDKLFGFDVFPDFFMVKVNGEHAIATDFLEGSFVATRPTMRTTEQIANLIRVGSVSKESLWTLQALMLLVANADSDGVNIIKLNNGRLVAIDQGAAFKFSFDSSGDGKTSPFDYFPMGMFAPAKYPRSFIEKLKTIKPKDWKQLLGQNISEAELEFLIYRQEFILTDVKLRGDAALF